MPGTRGSVVRTVGPFDASRLVYIGTSHSCIEFSIESILLLKFKQSGSVKMEIIETETQDRFVY